MASLIPFPARFALPLATGGDLYVGFIYKPLVTDESGEPVLDADGKRQYAVADYPAGATLALTIDTATPIIVDADIVGAVATVWEDKAVADTVAANLLWRAVLTLADGRDVVLCNGRTMRSDG